MAAVDNRDEIMAAMRGVGVHLKADILKKCMSTCANLHIEASQMAESWEAYSLNKNVMDLDEHTFPSFRKVLVRDLENRRISEMDTGDSQSAIRSVPGMLKRSRNDEHLHTPTKMEDTEGTQRRVSLSPKQLSVQMPQYGQRRGAGSTVFTYNPSNLDLVSDAPNQPCTDIRLFGTCNVETQYRYMFTTLEQRANALDEYLVQMEGAFLNEAEIPDYETIGVPNQNPVTCIGRVCNEAHDGKINATSVLLEAPRRDNGIRTSMRLDSLPDSYSLFPGQIVKVSGVNASGRSLVATAIAEGCPLPKVKTPAKDLLKFQHLGKAQGRPLQIVTVCGPYTTSDNLEYEPLTDFIVGTVRVHKPDVIVMMGPFVDLRQPLLQKNKVDLPLEDGATLPVSHETLFAGKISAILEQLYEDEPNLHTQFVLVPSTDDGVSEPVYPQPPLADRVPNGKAIDLPGAEGIEFGSLSLHHLPANRIHCVSNPCTLQINEITIGITSTDTLLHISSEETNSKLQGNRMSRIAHHLIQQRSFYPLFPPQKDTPLDLSKMEQWKMDCTPDVLIVPSKLATFCRDVLDCVVINPGQLSKGSTGGTFASLCVYPMDRAALEGVEEGVEMEHNVQGRVRVDIKKI